MQKKQNYLIIGNGRLATHFAAYFNQLKIPFIHWFRQKGDSPDKYIQRANKILLAIKDDAIPGYISDYLSNLSSDQLIIHFSGSLVLDGINSTHPLITFGPEIYTKDFYSRIYFITEKEKPVFHELFPELPNPSIQIESSDKSLYHAWCSIAGNFPIIIWEHFKKHLETELNIPKNAIIPYIEKISENFMASDNALTGPFVRKDFNTINKHKAVLRGSEFLKIYNSFHDLYFKDLTNPEENDEISK